ncbi:hypothetical protein [Rhizobium herbae]
MNEKLTAQNRAVLSVLDQRRISANALSPEPDKTDFQNLAHPVLGSIGMEA